jgi:GT2 family glycosyltransferase
MLDAAEERQIVEVFGPCGGAGLYSRTMLDEIGYFDEDFFVYLEDVDLAWRARLAGWRCLFQPQARVYHAHSATLGQSSPLKRFWLGRNKVWLIAKNYPAPDLWRNLFWIIGYDLLAISYGVLSRGDLASLRGRWAGLRGLPRMLRKRKQLHQGALDLENWRRTLGPIESPLAIRSRYQHL